MEIDFVLGDHEVAVEVKSTNMVNPHHLKGMKHFSEEYTVNKMIIVSMDPYPRKIGNIMVLPWNQFLLQLWEGDIIHG